MNNVVLVGRLTKKPEFSNNKESKKLTVITLAVTRNYKNVNGIYETDFIRCVLWNSLAANTCEYCSQGDVIGIKGRLETSSYTAESGDVKYVTEVIAEKVTFLSSKDKKVTDEDEEKTSKKTKKIEKVEIDESLQ